MTESAERLLWVLCVLVAGCRREEPVPPPAVVAEAPAKRPAAAPVDRSASLVTLVCPEHEAMGFFFTPSRVLTRAHALCEAPKVRLHDGRTLLGVVKTVQRELDLAELEVAGGEGEPLPLGDSRTVHETDDVTVPGSGLGTVRSVTASRLGVPHYEVAFERVPAEGAPLVDAQGHAIAVVAGDSLALPVEALEASRAWLELERRAKPAIAAEARKVKKALERPGLAAALLGTDGRLRAIVLSRTAGAAPLTFRLKDCARTVMPAWEPFRVAAWFEPRGRTLFAYLDKHDLDIGLSMSTVEVPSSGCPATELVLDGADPLFATAPITKTAQPMTVTSAAPAVPTVVPVPVGAQPAEASAPVADERVWRDRFRALRSEQEKLETELRDKQRFIEQCDRGVRRTSFRSGAMMVLSPEDRDRYDQYKRDLDNADADRAAFQRKLDDLEREASNASVPREWRR